MEKTIRTFIAFDLPPEISQLAAALQDDLKARGLKLRWVRPQNIHLTLKFLGNIAPPRSEEVAAAMRRALLKVAPFELRVQGMGVFPGMRKPRVLWIGLGGQMDVLQILHGGLDDALSDLDFPKDRRSFKPHLTLARLDERVDKQLLLDGIQAVGGFAPRTFQAAELILYKSDLKPGGAVYTPLTRAPLGGISEPGLS